MAGVLCLWDAMSGTRYAVPGCVCEQGGCERCCVCQDVLCACACVPCQQRACVAGMYCHAMGNALFSFPLQKTGHSRRFGRFTHGALSYQDPTPPAAPSVPGWGPPPCYKGQQAEAGQGWTASCNHRTGS